MYMVLGPDHKNNHNSILSVYLYMDTKKKISAIIDQEQFVTIMT